MTGRNREKSDEKGSGKGCINYSERPCLIFGDSSSSSVSPLGDTDPQGVGGKAYDLEIWNI